ncbi:MAG: putative baseplate assembly protein [Spirochaetales bacterium]|nr:putative baseplate assembly protein [Spirochaetales bacterium]
MIPSPNLDDRTYQEIVDEAIRLIPHYCPEWTNHNPTDPGITLIELFAWMMEMTIYRLNRVPEKTYLTLLDLIGLSFMKPQPAKALISFSLVDGYDGFVKIKKGTQLSTTKTESAGSIVFETQNDVCVKNTRLASCIGTYDGRVTDNLAIPEEKRKKHGFFLFSGTNEINRYIYISDPVLGFLADNNVCNLVFHSPYSITGFDDEIINFLSWEYWNGKKWVLIDYTRALVIQNAEPELEQKFKKRDNELFFSGPIEIDETEIDGKTGYFLRASLVDQPEKQKCFDIISISINLLFGGEGLNPDACICNTENMIFHPIDITKTFTPFVDIPGYNDAFYIASNEVFSKEDSEIIIHIALSDEAGVDKAEPHKDLLLKYEYWNGKNWLALGGTTTSGVVKTDGKEDWYRFRDETNALTKSGFVRFHRPSDMKTTGVNGEENYWIRVRISAGDFGTAGKYVQTKEGKWEWIYERPVKPPMIKYIRLSYRADKKPPECLKVYNEYSYQDFTEKNAAHYSESRDDEKFADFYKIINITKEKCPITYLGFDREFPPGDTGIYFKLNEEKKVRPSREMVVDLSRTGVKDMKSKRVLTLRWEYWDGKSWTNLSVNDYTDSFHESGFVEFRTPENHKIKNEFGHKLYWMRILFESGSFEFSPIVHDLLLNSVYAFNQQTFRNELLGSSNGAPAQRFEIFHKPILPGIELYVKENCIPPETEKELILEEEGGDAIVVLNQGNGDREEIWIRYHEVENFYTSKPYSRHYCIDYLSSVIIFGDGTRGMIPPRMKNNIKLMKYKTGGGVSGNIGGHAITVLRENIPYVSGAVNHYPAEGGADLESIESLKTRASNVFRNLNRAVTAEDYEWLAMEASSSVARAKCLSKCGSHGEVILVIVPRLDPRDIDLKEKLNPSSELIRRVKEFLEPRKLVGTRLRVEPPAYRNISVEVKLIFKKDVSEVQGIKAEVEHCIRRALHPITGGLDGRGWPFGMALTRNEIYNVLEKVDGIYYIVEIEIRDNDLGAQIDKVILDEDSLIHIDSITIIDRKYHF